MTDSAPARFSGAFYYDFQVELYRGVFLPIRLHPNWCKLLIFGHNTGMSSTARLAGRMERIRTTH